MAALASTPWEIIKRNWTLDEFINSGYLDDWDINDDPSILEGWAGEISPEVKQLYWKIGWETFKEDLLIVYNNPGRLLLAGNKSSVWFRHNDAFLLFTVDTSFDLIDVTSFEDVFLSVISLSGEEIIISLPEPLDETIASAYDLFYNQQPEKINQLINELNSGRVIQITGFPVELAISPIVAMVNGFLFINSAYEIIVMGTIITPEGRLGSYDIYTYEDGQRLLAILGLNQDRWKLINL